MFEVLVVKDPHVMQAGTSGMGACRLTPPMTSFVTAVVTRACEARVMCTGSISSSGHA